MLNLQETALIIQKIRFFEEALDDLFEKGVISGTYHRCIGQEATAVGICSLLNNDVDYVVSNHRNHGHYLAFTEDYIGLLNELKGSTDGVTGGKGGSQVIFGKHFISNGILGSTVPVATGISLAVKRLQEKACVVCFLGDGALCEGIVYEALNMASLWSLPILYVVEMNYMAQSTKTEQIMAGSIKNRFQAFGIKTEELETTDSIKIANCADKLVKLIRSKSKPVALIIKAPRLCAHSKGDDPRSVQELEQAKLNDPLTIISHLVNDFPAIKKDAEKNIKKIFKVNK
jgi:TPP-dependent pyruvate/acetoin dehydrogenase alpha subunit